MSGVKHPGVKLHAVFNGHFWDVSVGPSEFSQAVGQCHRNSALGYGLDGAERYARLFAAAPDLLEALEALDASWLADFPAGPDGDYSDRFVSPAEEHVVIWRKLRAAIARATGDRPEKGGAL